MTEMTLAETFIEIWRQVMDSGDGPPKQVTIGGQTWRVRRTRSTQVHAVDFMFGEYDVTGIEQNPRKKTRWAKKAREGAKVMQFLCERQFIANVCDGVLNRYGIWKDLNLPE